MTKSDPRAIEKAALLIRRGGLVGMPTETVYGLAADARNDAAVAKVFDAKARPRINPFIIHVADAAMAARYSTLSDLARALIDAFWPGPLTIVAPRREGAEISLLASAGLDTLALRAPRHPIARGLIEASGAPLAAPSANRAGRVSPTAAEHVIASLGDAVDMVIDGGPCEIGLESTIVAVDGESVRLLRAGGLPRGDIEAAAGAPLLGPISSPTPQAPGMMTSHYAPRVDVRLNAQAPRPNELFLGFGGVRSGAAGALNLSAAGDLREAAANLFAYLRALDAACGEFGKTGVAVAPIPEEGLGEAINDRLRRAAAPRA